MSNVVCDKRIPAAVLAGGKSRRFGVDKALYQYKGKPLIAYVVERIHRASMISKVYVIASPSNAEALEKALGDSVEGIIVDKRLVGPLGGVLEALQAVGDCFIIACDMPFINYAFVDYIVKIYYEDEGNHLAYVPAWSNSLMEPLHAVYVEEITKLLEDFASRGTRSLQEALRKLEPRVYLIRIEELPREWQESLFNVNRAEDLREAPHHLG